jgi:AraC family transcriptional regulator
VDSLSIAVAAQLVERHSSLRRTVLQRRTRGLPDRELRRATDLMHECMGETLPLSELASTVGLSESQFTRAFKARTGEPPHRYLMGLRVDHARRLLQTTELSIAEIASSCGFASQEHLTRVMRARLSTTPAALRRSFG